MISWLPIVMSSLVGPNETRSNTSYSKLPIQIIYQCKTGCVRHEIMLEYSNESQGQQYIERDGMIFLPHRMRYWDEVEGKWSSFWEEVKPQPHIKKYFGVE